MLPLVAARLASP